MGDVLDNALQSQKSLATSKKELWDRCDFTTKQLELMTLDMKQKIHTITEDVESKVGKAMSEEIRRLSILIDEFNDPFHPDQLVLNVYKSRFESLFLQFNHRTRYYLFFAKIFFEKYFE